MDRRRLVLTASSAVALSGSAGLSPSAARQTLRSSVPEYVGAMTVMRSHARWVQREVSVLLESPNRDDEEWRIDVLAPFAVIDAVREGSRTITAPQKYGDAQVTWLEAVDEFVAAGLHLRSGVLDENERSLELARRALDQAMVLLDELDILMPRRMRGMT